MISKKQNTNLQITLVYWWTHKKIEPPPWGASHSNTLYLLKALIEFDSVGSFSFTVTQDVDANIKRLHSIKCYDEVQSLSKLKLEVLGGTL
jgi:hypothetical protein